MIRGVASLGPARHLYPRCTSVHPQYIYNYKLYMYEQTDCEDCCSTHFLRYLLP